MHEKAQNARKVTALSLAVAAELRAERAVARLTLDGLVRRSGVSRSTLNDILHGHKPADVSQLDAICDALRVDVHEIVRRADERRRRAAPSES